jgi:low temperature requirement protein LtrA
MARPPTFLRERGQHEARVTNEELFFDLIYAFAVTQLSHRLLDELSLTNAAQTLVLWFGVWLGWQYTCWVTNWFNPEARSLRYMLFVVMALGLLVAAAIPEAFADRGLVFALGYATIQVGRTVFVLLHLGPSHPLAANFTRILGWLCISAILWISGGVAGEKLRLLFWIGAVLCEYISPMTGFWLPGLGRSQTSDWTVDGGHIAERCQLFVMMALGESVLVSGASVSHAESWDLPTILALAVTLIINISIWWMYFNTKSKLGRKVIEGSSDPGRLAAYFHYVHVTLIGGIIVVAVANELIIAEPHARIEGPEAAVLVGGPMLLLLGNALYRKIIIGSIGRAYSVGLLVLALLVPLALHTDRLLYGALLAFVLAVLAAGEEARSSRQAGPAEPT